MKPSLCWVRFICRTYAIDPIMSWTFRNETQVYAMLLKQNLWCFGGHAPRKMGAVVIQLIPCAEFIAKYK